MERHSRTEYSFYNMFASFIGYGLNILLSFICRMVFVRCLSEEYLGISSLFTNIISVLSLSELGIGTAIVYALYKPIAEHDDQKVASLMKFYGTAYKAVGIVVGIVGIACIPFLDFIIGEAPNITENITVIYLMYLFSTASSYFFSYRSSIITATQRNYVVLTISYIVVIIQNIVQIIILISTRNYLLYLAIQIACTFITNVLISVKAKKDYPFIAEKNITPLSKDERWGLIKNIKALTVTKLSGVLVNNTDNIVITFFNGLVTTGAASNYTLLSTTLTSLLNQVFSSMSASIGNVNATENDDRKYFYFKAVNLANFWLYGWAAIGIACVSSDIVKLFFGQSYVLTYDIPLILAINFYMVGMQNAVWTYKSTLGLFKYGQYILLVTAALNIAGDIILGSQLGLFGIFLATAIARLLTNVWYDPYAVFKYGFHISPLHYLGNYLKYLVVLCFAGGLCWMICNIIEFNAIVNVLLKVIVCTVIPFLAFFLAERKTEEFQYDLKKVRVMLSGVIKKFSKKNYN